MRNYGQCISHRTRVAAFCGILFLLFASFSDAATQAQDVNSDAEVKLAREILDSWNGRAELLERAKSLLVHALETNPNNYLALKEAARYQIKSGYINNKDVQLNNNIYTVGNFVPGTLERAEFMIRKAIGINGKFAEGYVLLGHIQFLQSKLGDAEKSLKRAERLGTNDPWLQLNWASLHEAKGEHAAAEKRWRRVLQTGSDSAQAMQSAYGFLINNNKKAGKHEQAVALYRDQIQKYPGDAWLRGNFATYLSESLGRNEEAIAEARAALKIMDYGMGHRILGNALYQKWADMIASGYGQEAEPYFQEAFQNFPYLDEVMAYGAAVPGGEKLAKALTTQKQISIDARTDDGSTALLIATNRNRAHVVRALLDLNANPNTRANSGWTPLLSAADEGNLEIVSMLLAKGANVHGTLGGKDAIAMAERKGHRDIADLLRKRTPSAK